jgi:DNA-binding LacI/PurR family transcriptional regulator
MSARPSVAIKDDGLPESQFYQPPLSTIYQDFAALGEVGLEYLLEMINRPGGIAKRYLLKPILVPRKSTKRAWKSSP